MEWDYATPHKRRRRIPDEEGDVGESGTRQVKSQNLSPRANEVLIRSGRLALTDVSSLREDRPPGSLTRPNNYTSRLAGEMQLRIGVRPVMRERWWPFG